MFQQGPCQFDCANFYCSFVQKNYDKKIIETVCIQAFDACGCSPDNRDRISVEFR